MGSEDSADIYISKVKKIKIYSEYFLKFIMIMSDCKQSNLKRFTEII